MPILFVKIDPAFRHVIEAAHRVRGADQLQMGVPDTQFFDDILSVKFIFQYLRTSLAVGFEGINVRLHSLAITLDIDVGHFERFREKQWEINAILDALL